MVPLEANLDEEDDDTDMVALLFQKVDKISEKVKAFNQYDLPCVCCCHRTLFQVKLSSSSTIEGEGMQEWMVRKTRTGPIRQDTKEVEHQAMCCYFIGLSNKSCYCRLDLVYCSVSVEEGIEAGEKKGIRKGKDNQEKPEDTGNQAILQGNIKRGGGEEETESQVTKRKEGTLHRYHIA